MQRETVNQLLNRAVPEIRSEARLLLAKVLQCEPTWLLAHPEFQLTKWQMWQYSWLLFRRARGIPLAYILGEKAFFSLDFKVNKYTLIPRPETEILVEAVLTELKKNNRPTTLIDVGTGSGCIPISIAKNTPVKLDIFALDIKPKTLQVAQENAVFHRTNITFLQSDLLKNLPDHVWQNAPTIITANLPYLSNLEFRTEPSIQAEPKIALIAADNGDALMKKLLEQIHQNFTGKQSVSVFLEMNPLQISRLKNFSEKLFVCETQILPDLSGLNRVLHLSLLQARKLE